MKILIGILVLWSIGMLWLVYEIYNAVEMDDYDHSIDKEINIK